MRMLHRFSTWITQEMGKTLPFRSLSPSTRVFHFLLLMLVVISFTFSAKAGSERIVLSTLSKE